MGSVTPGPWKVKCGATNRTGNPCKQWAVIGAAVCRMHGGGGSGRGAPSPAAVKAKSNRELVKQRIEELGDQAVETLATIMNGTWATKDTDRLKAAEMVLERIVPKKAEVEHTHKDELDLDAEIAEALGEDLEGLGLTGTDDDV